MSLPELKPQPWMAEGRCRQSDPEIFFPEHANQHTLEPARWICNRCPVQQACARYAIDHRLPFGIWGGTTPRQREAIWQREAAA